MPYVSRPRDRAAGVAVVRDIQAIPYRQTSAYRRAVQAANAQKAQLTHRSAELWPTEAGQSMSGLSRRMAGGR